MQEVLKSHEADLIDRIRLTSFSKFNHVQFAVRRLFQILSEEPWSEVLHDKFNNSDLLCQVRGNSATDALQGHYAAS